MAQRFEAEACDEGVSEYITDLLANLSEMAGQAGLRRLAHDLEDVRQRHELGDDLIRQAIQIPRRTIDA